MVLAEPIVFTYYIKGKFIIRTNLIGPREFELSGLDCTVHVIYKTDNIQMRGYFHSQLVSVIKALNFNYC